MKKSLFIFSTIGIMLIGIVACNKDNTATEMQPIIESELQDNADDNYEYEESAIEPVELEDRAASLTSVALKTPNAVSSSDACHKIGHEGYNIIAARTGSQWNLAGSELGTGSVTTKSNVTLQKYVKAIVYQSSPAFNKAKTDTVTCTGIVWGASSIDAILPAIAFDSLRTFSVKFIVGIPTLSKDSTTASYKIKSKTAKCIGTFLGARYGNFNWSVNLLAKYGNAQKLPTGMSIVNGNSSLVASPAYGTAANLVTDSTNLTLLQVGDIVERANGTKGLVYGVSARDPKKGYKVRIQQIVCDKASIKNGTWTFVYPLGMKAKTDETTGSWTKFARKQ
jgi:hypothetical protein